MKKLIYFFLLISSLIPQVLCGQQFNFQNYSLDEGLKQSQVYAMIEDHMGYIWAGTQAGGVCRFDGRTFKQFSTKEGLINNYVEALFEDRDGNIWIGTQKGLSKFDGKKFQNFKHPKSNFITAITQEPSGKFWIGTSSGTYQFDGEKFTDFEIPSSRVNCFFYDIKDNLWIGTDDDGAYKFRDGKIIRNFTLADGLINNNIKSIIQDASGNLHFGSFDGGINVYNGAYFSYFRKAEGLSSNLIQHLHLDKKGKIWIGTQDMGITIWNPTDSTFKSLDESDGLPSNSIRKILEDHWGNHWFGTSGGGVSKYSGQQFLHYNKTNGLAGNQVYAIAKDASENFWLSTGTRGVSFFDGKKFTHYGVDSGFLDVKSKALLVDDSSRVWIGTEGKGISLYARDTFRFFSDEEGLGGNHIRDIVQDKKGRIWVATAGDGITLINIFKSKILPPPRPSGIPDSLYSPPPIRHEDYLTFKIYRRGDAGLASNRINDLHLDREGRLWFATRNNGIGFFKDDETIYTISSDDGLIENNVRSLAEDDYGNLWIGTASQGICKIKLYIDSIKVETFKEENNTLTSKNIYQLSFDNNQNLWAGSEVGVDQITLDKNRNIIGIKHYGKAAGFVGIETCQNAVVKDSLGNLWFGTINGLTKYNPKTVTNNPVPPILSITSVQLNYKNLEETDYQAFAAPRGGILPGLELPWNQNNLEFEFQGINHSNPEKVLFQWKLEGFDEDWTPLRNRNIASFPSLPPNNYTFLLRAANEDGIINETPLELSFEITPAFWQTWWFKLVSALLGILLIGWIIKNRINRIRQNAKREKEKLEIEKHLIGLEQKALQLQMNPHFIFNALNSIQSLISQKDNKTARYQLAKFSKLMRSILENSRVQSIQLYDEIQTLKNYLAIEQSSRGNTFDFEISTAEDIDPEELSIPPMMLQPFVENAIIHGVAHIKEKGKIEVHFSQKNNTLVCAITDNGIGRSKAKELKSQVEHQHKSMALEVTQERLDILNKDIKGQKSLEFIDLMDDEGNAAGTKVVIRLPVEN